MTQIHLSLVSHTNVGKTTLARTLLRRDVGEVRDAPHVTELSTAYRLIETPDGSALELWDTPGFGDSARLLRRLKLAGSPFNPLGWLLSQVWDRFTDRPFWCSQQAVRNVRAEADVVLYLVNAAEEPSEAGYVDLEMELLAWTGKPIILLLNQLGPPRPIDEEAAEERLWRTHLARFASVRDVLPLDAFARCWVQEGRLFDAIAAVLPEDKAPALAGLRGAWREQNLQVFRRSMQALSRQITAAALDSEALQTATVGQRLRAAVKTLGRSTPSGAAEDGAMAALAKRLDESIRASTDELIRLHGLEGRAAPEVLQRLAEDYAVRKPIHEGYAAALGGFVSGAASGLIADLAAGGLTFGAAALGGGIAGALGASSLARGLNIARGQTEAMVRWSSDVLLRLFGLALLSYLAVAHFGRGRGDYTASEHPAFWRNEVNTIVTAHRPALEALFRDPSPQEAALQEALERLLTQAAAELLERLYPGSRALFV